MRESSIARLLTAHFLRRFLDNDLISPNLDSHDNLATLGAAFLTSTLFLSVFLATGTMFGIPTPGVTAVKGLGARFFFIAGPMIVMALVAAIQWNALSLDARDMSNLGPLPLERGALVRAKLAAVATLAIGFAIALNLIPSLVYESLLALKMPVGLGGLAQLVGAHAIVSMAASAFGFLSIVALRELLRLVFGERGFRRVSIVAQALLVLMLVSAFLLLPGFASTLTRSWVATGFPAPYAVPPLWFLGWQETLAGGVIANLTGLRFEGNLDDTNRRLLAMYHAHDALFRDLGGMAPLALGIVAIVATAAYAWNMRRPPQPTPESTRRRYAIDILAKVVVGRHPMTRAGFTFALQAAFRSLPHRLSIAAASAVAFAVCFVMMRNIDLGGSMNPATLPLSILGLQTVVLTIVLAGFRHALRVPADLPANWIFQLSWNGDDRRYLAGVKRAAIVALAGCVLTILFPFHLWVLGARAALVHAAVGSLLSVAWVETLFAGVRKLPFAAAYVPGGHVKTLGPIVVLSFVFFTYAFAWFERAALTSDRAFAILTAALILWFMTFRLLDLWKRRARLPMDFGDAPEPATQWLGLSG